MKLQYFTSIHTDTEEVNYLLKNKIEIPNLPFDYEDKGKYYKTTAFDNKEAYLIIEEEKYLNVFY